MNELRGLLAQTYASVVDKDELRAAVAHCLANLFARQRLQLFWFTANQHDGAGVTNIAMGC